MLPKALRGWDLKNVHDFNLALAAMEVSLDSTMKDFEEEL